MSPIALTDGNIHLDAALIAADLGLDCAGVLEAMRARRLTSVCEQGIDEDAGRSRMTFYHGNTRLRLIVDSQGQIVERSVTRLQPLRRKSPPERRGDPALGADPSGQPDAARLPHRATVRGSGEV